MYELVSEKRKHMTSKVNDNSKAIKRGVTLDLVCMS